MLAAPLLLVVLLAPSPELKLPGLFSDGMVLQRDMACPVWGWAEPGEEVTVAIAGQTKSVRAGADGRWKLRLDPLPAGGPHELAVRASKTLTIRNVLVGEVWLAVGGANLEVPVKATKGAPSEVTGSSIRLFTVPGKDQEEAATDVAATWKESGVADFSAAAYYFGRELVDQLKVPVGLIQATWSDPRAELWVLPSDLQAQPALRGLLMNYRMQRGNFDSAMTWYLFRARQARENGEPPPDEKLVKPPKIFHPGCLYNGMIAPLVPYGLRGVIWGEGEADLVIHYYHAPVLAAMIQGWRGAWGQGNFPIVGLQLSSYGAREETPGSTLWGELRGAQAKAFGAPNTGLVVTADLNEEGEPLPKNKLDVGRRAARWALGKVYGREGSDSGPSLERVSIEESRVRVVFANLGGGLQVRGERLAGFAIAGEDKVYQWAEAAIDGPSVLLSSPKVPKPVAVRYGWSDHPDLTLFSRDGWPAGPFRSEPWVTEPPPPRGRR